MVRVFMVSVRMETVYQVDSWGYMKHRNTGIGRAGDRAPAQSVDESRPLRFRSEREFGSDSMPRPALREDFAPCYRYL